MNKYLFAGLLVLLGISKAIAQKQGQAKLDSLLSEVTKMEQDTIGVKLLNRVAYMYASIEPEEGVKWAKKGLELANKVNWEKGRGVSYSNLGNNYQTLSNYPAALDAFYKSLHIFEAIDYKKGAGMSLSSIGTIYMRRAEYDRALEYSFKALHLAEASGDEALRVIALSDIGATYVDKNDAGKALNYSLEAFRISTERQDIQHMALNTGNIGCAYQVLNEYSKALSYYFKGLQIGTDMGDKAFVANVLGNIGSLYCIIARDSVAIRPDSLIAASSEANRKLGIDYLRKSIAASLALKYYEMVPDYAENLADALARKGDYQGAYAAHQQYTMFKDSLYSVANSEKIAKLETQRVIELKNKDLQIAKLAQGKRRNERALFIVALLAFASIAGFVVRQNIQRKKANQRLALSNQQLDEANRVKARFFGILSHDLRAPIANLTGYLHLQREAPEMMPDEERVTYQLTIENAANNLLAVMEDLLLWSKGQMTSFRPQIHSVQVVQLFDEIKKLIPHDTAINVVFNDPGLLTMNTDEHFLKTIMRNLTANALAALNNQPNGKIDWNAWEESGTKYLSITDNGPGLTKAQQDGLFAESAVTSLTAGLGLHIVRDFVQMLGQKIEVRSEAGKGTTFLLSSAA